MPAKSARPSSCRHPISSTASITTATGHVDLRHSVPDVMAFTANLLKVNGWRAGAPFSEGTENFEVMREWNHAEIYRKAMVLFAERLRER